MSDESTTPQEEHDFINDPRRWFVVCGLGWGRGETLLEACENAHVSSTYQPGAVFYAHPKYVKGLIQPGEIYGARWNWTEDFLSIESPELQTLIKDHIVCREEGKLRIYKNKLQVLVEVKE